MATIDMNTGWEKIQKGLKETERLMGLKQYNLSMVKARQTLEYMVRCLGDKACIVEGDLSGSIDDLFLGRWISKTTCEHYHKIRILGNKAIHEGNDNAYDANQAYHLLSQEVHTFAESYNARKKRTAPPGSTGGRPASSSSSQNRSRKRRKKKKGFYLSQYDLLKILILIICVLLIFAVIKFIIPDKKTDKETTAPTTTEEQVTTAAEPVSTEPTTVTPTTVAAEVYKVTGSSVRVRQKPGTGSDSAVIATLSAGATVEYKGAYNDEWAIIIYEGNEAYIASQYIAKQE